MYHLPTGADSVSKFLDAIASSAALTTGSFDADSFMSTAPL